MDLSKSPYFSISDKKVTALDKVFVCLRVVETSNDRPNGGDGSGDLLDHGGATLVRADLVCVVHGYRVRDLGCAW